MNKFKLGDKVKVLSGRDKGREGTIAKIFPKDFTAIVEGINIYKKHIKKSMTQDGNGGVFEFPRPINLSKLSLVGDGKKAVKVGFKVEGDQKIRLDRKTGKVIDTKTTKK